MIKRSKPAVDAALSPQTGHSRDGQPLSYNRAPLPELAPWIARLYVTSVHVPEGYRLDCGLFNDISCMRIQLDGEWAAETADGALTQGKAALYMGPQTRRMPVAVTGSFMSVGAAFRPGTAHSLKGPKVGIYNDRIVTTDDVGMPSERILSMFEPEMTPEEMLRALESSFVRWIDRAGTRLPDPISTRFETACFTDPTMSVGEFARECDIAPRRLERIVNRDFGVSPKQALRRARALDMASHLLGVADHEEAEELALRYYDQSHLIRDFVHFFMLTPSKLLAFPRPLLTAALESRQARRLEIIERLTPGAVRPWQ